jgi:hypothetical protein
MSQHSQTNALSDNWLIPRARTDRWVYIVAMLLPAWGALDAVLSPFPSYGYTTWLSGAVAVVCALQFYRPTVVLWLPLLLWYAWGSFQAILREIGAFRDYGSEDHSRWEGWHTEWMFLAFTALLVCLTLLIAVQGRLRRQDAT